MFTDREENYKGEISNSQLCIVEKYTENRISAENPRRTGAASSMEALPARRGPCLPWAWRLTFLYQDIPEDLRIELINDPLGFCRDHLRGHVGVCGIPGLLEGDLVHDRGPFKGARLGAVVNRHRGADGAVVIDPLGIDGR